MKKILTVVVLLFTCCCNAQSNDFEKSILQLQESLKKAPAYDKLKLKEISLLRNALAEIKKKNDPAAVYLLYERLYESYKLFQYDSSYWYGTKLLAISQSLKDPVLINLARIKLGFSFLSSGMYKETLDTLSMINTAILPDSIKTAYYVLMGRYYSDLADYANDQFHAPAYLAKMSTYIDSALVLWPPQSYEHLYYKGLKNFRTGNNSEAKVNFEKALALPNLTAHEIAVTNSTFANLYIKEKERDKAIALLMQAVIADVESATKETSAAYWLSVLLYEKRDIKNASLCINRAFEDAAFYGARQRKMQITTILPLIEAQKFAIVDGQKNKLIGYAVLVTFLLILVIFLGVVVFNQIKKLRLAQKNSLAAHEKTQEANRNLSDINDKLNDANKIKEEYIGYFFNVNAGFFDKIERFKKMVGKKIADRKIDEIGALVNAIDLKNEKQELLKHFDRAFLRLFPDFVPKFNELFKIEDHVVLEEHELLNTDLRIFALARMGIHENEKIAQILQYSVNTINTYKTRIKNKSIVANDEFEKHIMQIKTV